MALIVSLILLLVLTLLGLAAMQNTSLEERMAGNVRAENVAFQAAESALRAGESWITAQGTQPKTPATISSPPSSGQVWALDGPDATSAAWWLNKDAKWWADYGVAYASPLLYTASEALAVAPRYVNEQAGFVRDSLVIGQQQDYSGRWFYQVTSRGVDPGGRGEAMLRSTIARRF
jgi:type IV pilus assembly protein PilX